MTNPIVNFCKYTKKHGIRKAWKEWKYQFVMAETPELTYQKMIWGYSTSLVGSVLGSIYLTILTIQGIQPFYMPLLFIGLTIIFYTQLKGQIKMLENYKDILKQQEELLNEEKKI